ncbi:MAG: alcohol dehydrogenase catalytic domain-containing protein [Candidatus Tectomicrobia bacterium]|nr:alcohol dehydrogenase catalytic domain-containing protein [Candidatus Tectomicrobia bacterium]
MKVARLYDIDKIIVEEEEVPKPGPGEALVKMKACGICSSDVTPWYVRRKAPLVLGHEPAGVIAKIGQDVTNVRVGDRVFLHHHAPCLACSLCRRGLYTLCETWKKSKIVPGGIAEYVLIPDINLRHDTLILPEEISYEDGTLVEPTACVVKSLKKGGLASGDTLLVIGLGVMGQLHILLSRHYGTRTIIGADRVGYRLEKAKEFGADYLIDVSERNLIDEVQEATGGAMADLVIVGPGSAGAMQTGIACTGKGGRVLFFAPAPEEVTLEINPFFLYFQEVTLLSSYSCGPYDTREALELARKRVVSAEKLVTHRFPIEETAQACRTTAEAGDSLKAIIVF